MLLQFYMVKSPTEYRYHLLVLALVTSVTAPMSTPGAALTAETGLLSTRRLRRGWSHGALLLCHSVTLGTLPTTPTPTLHSVVCTQNINAMP